MTEQEIKDMIASSVSSALEARNTNDSTEKADIALNAAQEVSFENEMNPTWAKHTVKALNAVRAFSRGERSEGESLMADFKNSRSGMSTQALKAEDKEAIEIVKRSGLSKVAQFRALNTATNSEGGFLLPKPFLAEVFVTLEEYGVARREFRGIPMSTDKLDLKDIATKPSVFWVNELANIPNATIAFGEKQLVAKKLSALLPWSIELQEDSAFAVVPLAAQLFAEAFAFAEDRAGFVGAGLGDTANAGFTGMLHAAGKVHTLAATNTTFDKVTWSDVLTGVRKLTPAQRRGAKIFMSTGVIGVLENQKGTDGQFVYKAPSSPDGTASAWGLPIVEVQVMPELDAASQANSRFIVIGNPANMLMGTNGGAEFRIFDQATIANSQGEVTYSAVQNDGAVLRVRERVGFEMTQANNVVAIRTATA